jgi:hypothetical protein
MKHWYFWILAPVMIALAIFVPVTFEPRTLDDRLTQYGFSAVLVLATLGLADAARFRWALRCVAVAALAAGAIYFVTQFAGWLSGKPFGLFGPPSERSLRNACLFLLFYGVPAFLYLVRSRSGSAANAIAARREVAVVPPDKPA